MEIHYNVYGCFRDPQADVELAKTAVDAGFEGVWIGDHFMPWIDSRPFTHHVLPWFGTLLNEIPEVPVGTSVTCPMLRHEPAEFAQAIATIDAMYPGRFNLGVGTGEAFNELPFLSEWPEWGERASMLAESIELMRDLWDGEYIDFDGEHFQHEAIKLYTAPEEQIPIHWAGWGPRSCQLAGEVADHLLTNAGPSDLEDRIVPNLEKGLDRSGRSLADVDVSTEMAANVGDPDALVAEIRERGEHIPRMERHEADPRAVQEAAHAELEGMSDEAVRETNNITDDPSDLVEQIEALEEAGATRVLVGSNCGDAQATIEVFEDDVLPAF
jgi:coenzyme F420-dependent glucose-6-phosphate dehydrogenase